MPIDYAARSNRLSRKYGSGRRRLGAFSNNHITVGLPFSHISTRRRLTGTRTRETGSTPVRASKRVRIASPAPRTKTVARRSAPGARQSTRQFGQTSTATQNIQQRVLTVNAVSFPSQGADVGLRLGTTIRVSGVKICETIRNNAKFPILLHYAIIQPKNRGVTDTNLVRAGFFRNTNVLPDADPPGNSRATTFTDAQNGDETNNAYDYSYSCNNINPDAFHVLTHKRVVLSPAIVADDLPGEAGGEHINQQANRYIFQHDKYYNLKGKRMTFTNQGDNQPEHPILRVIWWQALSGEDWDPTNSNNADDVIQRDSRSVVFFRNGLN